MEISTEKFEQSLKKISPEMSDTMKLLFDRARRRLQDNIASPLIKPKFKKAFNATVNNLESIKRFIVEEAEKLQKNDQKASKQIVDQYIKLLEEIDDASEYLFLSTQDREIDEMENDLNKLKKETDKLTKETDTYQPSEKEIDEVLKKIDGK